MQTALAALTEELRRLQSSGVKRLAVSDEGLASLRAAVKSHRTVRAEAPPASALPPAAKAAAPVAAAPAMPRPPSLPELLAPLQGLPDPAARLAALREVVRHDPNCQAHLRPGRQVVFGVGHPQARIFFVGEAPGAEEEVQGEPFVGPAGQLLNRMITGMGLQRGDVYIGNIMNWRPEMPTGPGEEQSGNRPPTTAEMAYCLPYLLAQIEIVRPAILMALGTTAAQGLLGAGSFRTLGEIRGRWKEFAGVPLMVTYHPSYVLRNPTNRTKRLIWEDFLQVMARAELPISDRQRGYFLESKG
jgi:uracil-DNA glycosylase